MYDDLARSQRPSSLEWLVVHTVIPSVLLTLVFAAALFRPGRFGGKAGAAWIVIAIDFNLARE